MPKIKPIDSFQYRAKPLIRTLAEAFPTHLGDGYCDFEHWWNGDQGFEPVRLFSRWGAKSFWTRLGYFPESNPRYLQKKLTT